MKKFLLGLLAGLLLAGLLVFAAVALSPGSVSAHADSGHWVIFPDGGRKGVICGANINNPEGTITAYPDDLLPVWWLECHPFLPPMDNGR